MDPIPFQASRPHPWHGLTVGPQPPSIVHAFIEITPYDLVKYEVDKLSGYMRVDRPQRSSSTPPTLYGFIPRTLCADRVAALSPNAHSADGDPLDICVLSERPINRGDIVIDARVIGGLQMLDDGEADDKILAVLVNDPAWGDARDIAEVPPLLVERLLHYFSTYKLRIGEASPTVIRDVYGFERAARVVEAALADYASVYPIAAD
ncbi:MAG: inorganic pyrophosphatase [Planctomycetes bacterium]|jgi:inorganic pyrophosphatase|nr:inorganic pyrophosphatase [Planctomycetota bacterium]